MAVYIVQGKLGTGKGKFVVGKMRDALREGKRVATNLDLWLENLLPKESRATVTRVPDKPTVADFEVMGHGNPDSYDEERNGLLVLDELGSWLNTRSYQDKHRADIIEWLIHARKHGWEVYLIVQNLDMIDKQVRVGLAEYLVKCIRADKLRIPVVGQLLGKRGRLPRFHIAQISMADVPGIQVDREMFRGDDLHSAYDTRQIFQSSYPHGPHSMLSAWHLKGRHEQPDPRRKLVPLKPKLPLVQRLAKLPPDRAWHWARLHAMGAV